MSNSKYYCKIKVSIKRVYLEDKKWHDELVWLHSNNLLSLVEYLDDKYPEWQWINVFDNYNKFHQIASFTKNRRPTSRVVDHYEKYCR